MTAVRAMIAAVSGQMTREMMMQMMGWMVPRMRMFQTKLGTKDTSQLWVSRSQKMMESRWMVRLKAGTNTGPMAASSKLVKEMTRHSRGNSELIKRVPRRPLRT